MDQPHPDRLRIDDRLRRARSRRRLRDGARLACLALATALASQALCIGFGPRPDAGLDLDAILTVGFAGLIGAGVGLVLAMAVAWHRHRRLADTAQAAEQAIPGLGLALSTSLEVERTDASPSIRQALWADTLHRIDGSPWKRFTGAGAGLVYAGIALALVITQTIAFHGPDPLMVRMMVAQAAKPDAASATAMRKPGTAATATLALPAAGLTAAQLAEKPAASTEPAKPTFRAKLELKDPDGDRWTTAVETIPVTVGADTSHGLTNLRLTIRINDRQPAVEVLASTQPEGPHRFTTAVTMAAIGAVDFDVITLSAEAEAQHPDGSTRHLVSPLRMIQIMPFRKSTGPGGSGGGGGEDRILQLIEAERQVLKGAWMLANDQTMESDDPARRTIAGQLVQAQRVTRERTTDLHQEMLTRAGAEISATGQQIMAQFERAETRMTDAEIDLQVDHWDAAQTPARDAQAALVEIQRLTGGALKESSCRCNTPRPVIAKANPKPPPPPSNPPNQPKPQLAVPKVHRTQHEPDDLPSLVEAQAALNRDGDAVAGNPSATQLDRSAALAERQRTLRTITEAIARAATAPERTADGAVSSVPALLLGAMEQQALQASTYGSSPGQIPAAGEQALYLLRQAAQAADGEARQARSGQVQQAIDQASRAAADSTTRPERSIASLLALAQALDQLAATPPTDDRDAARRAKAEAEQLHLRNAAETARQAANGALPADAPLPHLAEALRAQLGDTEHRRRLVRELSAWERQAQAVAQQLRQHDGKTGEPAPAIKAWAEALQERRAGLQAEAARHQKLGTPSSSLQQLMRTAAAASHACQNPGSAPGPGRIANPATTTSPPKSGPPTPHSGGSSGYAPSVAAVEAFASSVAELRQELIATGGDDRELTTGMSGVEVPAEYREPVNRYYDRLSNDRPSTSGPEVP